MNLLYVNPANKHDVTIIKENEEDFGEKFRDCTVLLNKCYVDKRFAEAMRAKNAEYVAIKRDNMIKGENEKLYYKLL